MNCQQYKYHYAGLPLQHRVDAINRLRFSLFNTADSDMRILKYLSILKKEIPNSGFKPSFNLFGPKNSEERIFEELNNQKQELRKTAR